MDDDRTRELAREGMRPLLGETPQGPSWEELIASSGSKRRPAWAAAALTAAIVLGGVALLPFLIGETPGAGSSTTQAPTTTALSPSTSIAPSTTLASTTTLPPSGLPLEAPVPLQVLSLHSRFGLEMLDLQLGTRTNYRDVLSGIGGAVYNSQRELILWNNEVAYVFVLDPLEAEQELRPAQSSPTGAMWVVPATDGDTAWIVQPGLEGDPTMLELRNIENGERLITAEADPGLTPVGATVDGLVFNTGGNQVVLFTNSGATLPLGNGRAITTNDTSVVALTCSGDLPADCEELWFGRTDETDIFYITKPDQGAWTPFETTLPVISPDGTKLLIGFGLPTTTVHMVDLVDGGVQPIALYVPDMHPAWSADGNWIALISGSDVDLINASDPTQVVPLRNVIPTGFVPIAAG